MASSASRVEMKALQGRAAALMPHHEVCLSAFSHLDPGSQSERCLFVSECRRSSPRLNAAVGLLNRSTGSEANLTVQLLPISAVRTVVELYG